MDEDDGLEWKNNINSQVPLESPSDQSATKRREIADSNENKLRDSDCRSLGDKPAADRSDNSRGDAIRFNNNSLSHGHDFDSCHFCNLTPKKMSGKCFPASRNVSRLSEEATKVNNSSVRLVASYPQQQSYEDNDEDIYNVKINNTDVATIKKSCSGRNLNNIESEIVSNKSESTVLYEMENKNHGEFNISVPSTSGVNGHCSSESSLEKDVLDLKEDKLPKPSRKRPNHLRKKKMTEKEVDSSSDTGNDDYSLGSEDGCIYTYRGGEHLADLPSSFFSLDMGVAIDNSHLPAPPLFGVRPEPLADERQARASGASSPDMDYLEMDFDPGPSCEVDTNDESSVDLDLEAVSAQRRNPPDLDNFPENRPPSPIVANVRSASNIELCDSFENAHNESSCHPDETYNIHNINVQPSTSKQNDLPAVRSLAEAVASTVPVCSSKGSLIPHTTVNGDVIYVRRTGFNWPSQWEILYHHNTTGDLVSPSEATEGEISENSLWSYPNNGGCIGNTGEITSNLDMNRVNLSSALFHCTMAKKLVVEKQNATFLQEPDNSNVDGPCVEECDTPAPIPRCMLWSETEACSRQVTQLGTSACGATAVVNALIALDQPIDVDAVASGVGVRLRAPPPASLSRYLLSRAVAGCSAGAPSNGGLRGGIHLATDGRVSSRFFATWPERCFSLSHWLAYWISLGAVPIATLNLQTTVSDPTRIPDSWHHQMIFGVSPRGVFLSNPLECVSEGALWSGLCSDSVLLVRRKDVLSRWNASTDLTPLMSVPGDTRWTSMNVVGQVVSMVREDRSVFAGSRSQSTHIRVPASYRAGVTIAARTGSEAHKRLVKAPELPLYILDDNVK